MSLIATRLSLTHRCTIQRPSAGTDDWGNQEPPEWTDHLTDQPCRAAVQAGREQAADDSTVVVEDMRLLLTTDVDVTETDRIAEVTERGAVVVAGPVGIRAVLRHRDHLELVLVRIS